MKKILCLVLLFNLILSNLTFGKEFRDSFLISHRGSWICRQENGKNEFLPHNSMESFKETAKVGFYACEGDLQYDKQMDWLYMSHDPLTDKLEILDCPSLAEYLIVLKKDNVRPLIDMKWSTNTKKMIECINNLKMNDMVIAQCQDPNKLDLLKDSGIDICLLIGESLLQDDLWLDRALKYNVKMINIAHNLITLDIINKCEQNNIDICVYSVNDWKHRDELRALGADFIMTDNNW